jgi:hypothetical protein
MKKNILYALCALLLQVPATHATSWGGGNPFMEMMRSMLNMFELMQLYQNYSGYSNLSGMPQQFSPGQFNYGPFSQLDNNRSRAAPPTFGTSSSSPSIDGLWASNANTLLLIQQDYAQIYWSRSQYRNYYLRKSKNQLQFTDAETRQLQTFDMAAQADQMALRDKEGKQLLFRKLSTEPIRHY